MNSTQINHVKGLAARMLETLDHTPRGPQKVLDELLPCAEFFNGITAPNDRPPVAVYLTLGGRQYRRVRGKNRWLTTRNP
jgi:hypothetical protein